MPVHYQKGQRAAVAFVFSSPGRHEADAGCPAAKANGTQLRDLLAKLNVALCRSDLERTNITIAYSWPRVEYIELTARSEATDSDIRTPANVARLGKEIAHVTDFIVFCGRKARVASEALIDRGLLPAGPKLFFLESLGDRGLKQISLDLAGVPIVSANWQRASGRPRSKRAKGKENIERRLDVVVNRLMQQYNSPVAA